MRPFHGEILRRLTESDTRLIPLFYIRRIFGVGESSLTYSVHAFKSLLLKSNGFGAIAGDVAYLLVFSVVAMTAATLLFRRTL